MLTKSNNTEIKDIIKLLENVDRPTMVAALLDNPMKKNWAYNVLEDISKAQNELKWSPKISLEEGIEAGNLDREKLLQLFRIHGAFLFGIGTFHGDLHPGNCIIDEDGKFVFIDNGAICHAPQHVNRTLFTFFEHLSKKQLTQSFYALLKLSLTETCFPKELFSERLNGRLGIFINSSLID